MAATQQLESMNSIHTSNMIHLKINPEREKIPICKMISPSKREMCKGQHRICQVLPSEYFFFLDIIYFFLAMFYFFLILLFILAVLGLHCCPQSSSSCSKWGLRSSCAARASHCGGPSCRKHRL